MKVSKSFRSFFSFALVFAFLLGINANLAISQSRRLPPTTNDKKNKRPGDPEKEGEKQQEPLPPELSAKPPKDIEKLTIATNVVNVDAVVYQKKTGQIVMGLKKPNFAIFVDGVQQTITNFSTPEAPITVAMVVEYSKWSEIFGYYGSGGYDPGTYDTPSRFGYARMSYHM